MTAAPSQETPAAMIDRVASLLQSFDGRPRLTLAQISRLANLPRSSAHRILQRLVDLGWVERDGFQYGLGLRMFELGSQVVRRDRAHQVALPFLHALHRSTGLTAHLSVLTAGDVLHLERIGARTETEPAWCTGGRQPAVHSAAGRALLAQLDESAWPELAFPPAASSHGVRGVSQLRRELDQVRERGGVAIDVRWCTAGVTAVAAAIGPVEAELCAAVSLSGSAGTMPVDHAVAAVRIAAMDIWYAASGVTRLRGRATPQISSPANDVSRVSARG